MPSKYKKWAGNQTAKGFFWFYFTSIFLRKQPRNPRPPPLNEKKFYADLHSHLLEQVFLDKEIFISKTDTWNHRMREVSFLMMCRSKKRAARLYIALVFFASVLGRLVSFKVETALSLMWTVLHWTVKQYCQTSLIDHPKCDHVVVAVTGQVARKSSRPKLYRSKPESWRPKFLDKSPEILIKSVCNISRSLSDNETKQAG